MKDEWLVEMKVKVAGKLVPWKEEETSMETITTKMLEKSEKKNHPDLNFEEKWKDSIRTND